jgi:hypothetical protein
VADATACTLGADEIERLRAALAKEHRRGYREGVLEARRRIERNGSLVGATTNDWFDAVAADETSATPEITGAISTRIVPCIHDLQVQPNTIKVHSPSHAECTACGTHWKT